MKKSWLTTLSKTALWNGKKYTYLDGQNYFAKKNFGGWGNLLSLCKKRWAWAKKLRKFIREWNQKWCENNQKLKKL